MDPQILSHFRSAWLSLHECITVQQAIDIEIKEIPPESLAESFRMLRAQRNTYALINACFHQSSWPRYSTRSFSAPRGCAVKKVLRLTASIQNILPSATFVESGGRSLSGTLHLWAGISLVSADVTALMLHRSKASPISIVCRLINVDEASDTVTLTLAHADRAFEIELVMFPVHIQNLVSKYLTKPMPFLKQLKLYRHGGSPWTATPECFLPPGCLEGANVLSHLYLIEVGVLPGSILPSTLTVLSLMYPPKRFTASQMIDLLEPLGNLRELRIQGILRPDASDTTEPSAVRRLSPCTHLVRFHLDAQAPERNDFMSRFPIMPETQISLSCDVVKPVYGARGLLRGLSLSFLSRSWIGGYSSASLPMIDSEMCFSVSVERHPVFSWHEVLRDLCATLPLDNVETLVVGTTRDFEKSTARLLGAHLHGVRTPRVEDQATKHMLQVLHPQARGISPAFPRLKALAVHYMPYDYGALDAHLLGPVSPIA